MATGADLVASARTRLNWQYEVDTGWDPVGHNQYRLTGAKRTTDCSGFVYLAAKDCGLTIPTVSWTQARWCHDAHTDGIPIADSLHIVGALLFKGDRMGLDGFGAGGHVAISMGDGVNVIEAEGHARDVLIDPALGEGHPWTNAARMPGLSYGTGPVVQPGPMIEGNPMYAADEICSVYTDGAGHTWGLTPTGAVLTLTGSVFHGSYGSLKDKAGHPLPAMADFGHITRRFDGKPGYSLWRINYHKGEHYDLPVAP